MRQPSLLSLLELRTDTAKPLYLQIEEQLVELIESGALPPGTVLPAERQLAEHLGVSRITVQRAYNGVRERQLLLGEGRKGSRIQQPAATLHPGMDRLRGFTEEMRDLGKVPSSRTVERLVTQDRLIASLFGLPSSARFLKLTRIRYGDGVPLSREVAWYDLAAAPAMEEGDLSGSVYAFLTDVCGVRLTHGDQTIEPTLPTESEGRIFGFSEPQPCLLLKRNSFTDKGLMIEYVEGLFRGDVYRYRVRLTI